MKLTDSPKAWDDCVKNDTGHTEADFEFLGGLVGEDGRAYRCKAHEVFYVIYPDKRVQTSERPKER